MIVLLLNERTQDDKSSFKPLGMSKRLGPYTSTVPYVLGKEE